MGDNKIDWDKYKCPPELERLYRENPDAYEGEMKYYRDINNAINTARELGRQEGIKIGYASVVRKYYNAGMSIEELASTFELSIDEVKKICAENEEK